MTEPALWSVLWTGCGALWVGCIAAWWRDRPAARTTLLAPAALGLLTGTVWAVGLDPASIPAENITLLQEGTTLEAVRNLGRVEAHTGPAWHPLITPLTGGRTDLRAILALNLLLTTWTAIGAGVVAARVAHSAVVGMMTALLVSIDPITWQLRWSEQASPTLGLLLLAAILPWATWRDPHRGRPVRALGLVTLVALTLGLGGIRPEIAALPLAAIGAGLLADLAPSLVTRADRGVGGALGRIHQGDGTARAAAGTIALVLGAIAAFAWTRQGHGPFNPWPGPLSWRLGVTGRWGWAVDALDPVNASWVKLPWMLPGLTPLGAALLIVLGLAVGLRHPLRTGGITLSILLLFRTFIAASHDSVYEMMRYLGPLVPLLGVLGAAGWRTLEAWEHPRADQVRALLLLTLLVPPLPRFATSAVPWPGDADAVPVFGLLDRNLQQEGRWLVAQTDAHPDCVLLTRTRRWSGRSVQLPPGTDPERPVVLGRGVLLWPRADQASDLVGWSIPDDSLRSGTTTLSGILGAAECVRVLHGRSCNGPAAAECARDVEGATELSRVRHGLRPYNHPKHPQPTSDPVEFVVYDLPPEVAALRFSSAAPSTAP